MNVFAFTTMAVLAAGSADASVQLIDGVWRSQGWGVRVGDSRRRFTGIRSHAARHMSPEIFGACLK